MASGTTNDSTNSAVTWPPVEVLEVEKACEASLTPKATEASESDRKKEAARAWNAPSRIPGFRRCTAYLSGCNVQHVDRAALDST